MSGRPKPFGPDTPCPDLVSSVEDYARTQYRHMRFEESEILPVARERLSAGDLSDIERELPAGDDPVFGPMTVSGFEALRRRLGVARS